MHAFPNSGPLFPTEAAATAKLQAPAAVRGGQGEVEVKQVSLGGWTLPVPTADMAEEMRGT